MLQGVSFEVPDGGVTALLGRNGVGKTTTLRSLSASSAATARSRYAGGLDRALPTHQIIRRGIGYVPEDREVFAGLTVDENLRLAERDAAPNYELVYDLFPELRTRGAQRAGTLSGGQQQMLAIGRALLNDNRLLLVDEPTKGLAPLLVTEVARRARADRASRRPCCSSSRTSASSAAWPSTSSSSTPGRVVHAGPAAEFLADRPRCTRCWGWERA